MTDRKTGATDPDLAYFRIWLRDVGELSEGELSDRAIARAFGVRHRLIASARAAWRKRNPLRRAWNHYRHSGKAWLRNPAAIAARADAVRRGEGLSVLAEMAAKEEAAHAFYASYYETQIAAAIEADEAAARAKAARTDAGI